MPVDWTTVIVSFLVAGVFLIIVSGLQPHSTGAKIWNFTLEVKGPFSPGAPLYRPISFFAALAMVATSISLVIFLAVLPPPNDPIVRGTPNEAELLGTGFASVKGPATIPTGGSDDVVLTVSLTEVFPATEALFVATSDGQPPTAGEPSISAANVLSRMLEDVPIYSRMGARLDAPSFSYQETEWQWKSVVGGKAQWSWVITAPTVAGSQVVLVSVKSPDGTGYEATVRIDVDVIQAPATATPTPALTPSPTFTPAPTATPTATPAGVPATGGNPAASSDSFPILALAAAVGLALMGSAYCALRGRRRLLDD